MRLAIKTAVVAGVMLTALFAAGCGASADGTPHGTVRSCAAYGVHAIEHRIKVTWKPAPCQGLSKAEVNQAVAMAVIRVAGDAPKAVRRKRAAEVAPYLRYLVTTLPPAASSFPVGSGSTGTSGRDRPMDVAALIAWVVAAGSGAYVLGTWLAHGGTLRRRAGSISTGTPPTVLFGHFGLALTGLVIWLAYLVTGWAALAWVAVAVLLPVAGLGMATLAIGLPGRRDVAAERHVGDPGSAADVGVARPGSGGSDKAGIGTPGTIRTATATGRGVRTGPADLDTAGAVSVRARLSPLVIAIHGVLAVTTMILVVLAALGRPAT